MNLRLVKGSTTINLNSGRIRTREYAPRSPGEDEAVIEQMDRDGGELLAVAYRDLVERAVVFFRECTLEEALSDLRAINRLFEDAREFQARAIGDRVFVEFRPDHREDFYRSEILYGRIDVDEGLFARRWHEGWFEASLFWKRRFFWEGPETQIPLTNMYATGDTAGLTIYNHYDFATSRDNSAWIDQDDVLGDLKAPLRLEMTNTTPAPVTTQRTNRVYVGHAYRSGVDAFVDVDNSWHILEGEDATGGIGSVVADATSSGGNYLALSWVGAMDDTEMLYWDLDSDRLAELGGNWYRLLARFSTGPTPTDLWLRWRIKLSTSTLWEGPLFKLAATRQFQDLGVAQFPPVANPGDATLYPLRLYLYGTAAGAGTLNLDFVQLTPMDSVRRFEPSGFGLAKDARLVDDGIEGRVYTDGWTTPGRTFHYRPYFQPIMSKPARHQRLFFLCDDLVDGMHKDRSMSVKVFYRPRFRTL